MSRMLELSQQKQERAVRGKYAEDKVRDRLKTLAERRADFDFERNYDARSSMGRIGKRTGDFTFYSLDGHGVIEVKQLKHDFRLPRKNFDPEKKFSILKKRRLAGGAVIVIVYHSTNDVWRLVPFEFFDERRDAASWDLSGFTPYIGVKSLQALMAEAGLR